MVLGKIKPAATIVAQFAVGVEVEAIQHDGKIFLPVVGLGEFAATTDAPEKPEKKHEPAPRKEKEQPKEESADDSKVYTEEELMDMDSKDIIKILKDEFGINPDDHKGKNTNKKLRELVLNAQEEEVESSDKDDDKDEKPNKKAPSKKSKDADDGDSEDEGDEAQDELVDQVADMLEDFDAGKKNKKKTIAAICDLSDDADEDAVTELVEKFEEDEEADIDDMAAEIVGTFAPKKKAQKDVKKSAKRGKKEDLVELDDLEVGDRVSVWWDDDNQDWFDGEVKSIKKGKVTIAYDDDTEDVIDPEVHTKIKRLDD